MHIFLVGGELVKSVVGQWDIDALVVALWHEVSSSVPQDRFGDIVGVRIPGVCHTFEDIRKLTLFQIAKVLLVDKVEKLQYLGKLKIKVKVSTVKDEMFLPYFVVAIDVEESVRLLYAGKVYPHFLLKLLQEVLKRGHGVLGHAHEVSEPIRLDCAVSSSLAELMLLLKVKEIFFS